MANVYTPPGASVTEQVTFAGGSPQIAPSSNMCLVGLTQGFQTVTDQIVINGTSANPLPTLVANVGSALSSVLSVTDALNPGNAHGGAGYTLTTDYTVSTLNGTITAVASGSGGTIPNGAIVYVTYTYIPANYFQAIRLDSLSAVQSRFGPAFNPAGTAINSPLSFGALNAFQNGAGSVICQPLFALTTPGNPATPQLQPNATQAAAATSWADTLFSLRGYEDIDIVVPVVGQSAANVTDAAQLAIFQAVQDHEAFMNNQEQFIFGVFGEDSSASSSTGQMTTIRTHAAALQSRYGGALNQQNIFINTSNFSAPLPSSNLSSLAVGGQYVAAAVAGALVARPASSGLTRQALTGFLGVLDNRLLSDKNIDAGSGLMVVEQVTASNVVRIRHSITTDLSGPARGEVNVVRAKFLMIQSIKETLENQIIGQIIADSQSPFTVRSVISGVLSLLQQQGEIVSFSTPICTLVSLLPTTITATFSYRPAFTLNFVSVNFSLDLTNSVVTAGSTS